MSASSYRSQLNRKRQQRLDAERKVGECRSKESKKRADADRARQAAIKSKIPSTQRSKLNEASRRENEAINAGREASRWQQKVNSYAKDEAALAAKVANAERSEAEAAERTRRRELKEAERRALSDRNALDARIRRAESTVSQAVGELRAPKSERLRVLLLGAASEGDLRIGREQKRIRAAVESALHRDLIDLDVRPAATTEDLLDGITKFRPHVVHFSGHSNKELILFEQEEDDFHDGNRVTASAFRHAVAATDEPPLLIFLNACDSAEHIDNLVEDVAPFAIGMTGEISDGDAMTYAARLYASITNGQSIRAAHLAGQAALELAGLDSAELPRLACSPGVEPALAILVEPPS